MKHPRWTLAAIPLLLVGVFGAACGDGPDDADASPTADSSFGPGPAFGAMITGAAPEHGSTVTKAATTAPAGQFGGTCAEVDFTKFPERADRERLQWFRMFVDEEDVTRDLSWFLEDDIDPLDGRVCYQPEAGLAPGRHEVIAAILDPQNITAGPIERVTWSFNVAE